MGVLRSQNFRISPAFLCFFVVAIGFFLYTDPAFAESKANFCPFTWNRTLKTGASGSDVLTLQKFLNSDSATAIAAAGDGSPGKETPYFGSLTKAAVARFQEKFSTDILAPNNLTKGTGLVGASTRAKLNALCGAVLGAETTAPAQTSAVSGNTLVVTIPEQPAHTLAPANALYVPFTKITLTAGDSDVMVSKVVVERVGPGRDNAFYDVGFLDPDGVEFDWGYLNALHQVTLHKGFTVPAHASQTYTVVGDMNFDLSGNEGEMPVLQVNALEASAPVTASFPIAGTAQSINATLTIGSATTVLSADDPRGDRTRYVNDTNATFAGIRITAGSAEDLKLTYLNWEMVGSASGADLTNVATVVDGVSYPATYDGRYYLSVFPGDGILIKKGDSVDVSAKGDFTATGANRTVEFDLYYGSDIGLTGTLYGFGVSPVPGGDTATEGNDAFLTDTGDTDGTSLTPYFAGSITTISGGAMTGVSK